MLLIEGYFLKYTGVISASQTSFCLRTFLKECLQVTFKIEVLSVSLILEFYIFYSEIADKASYFFLSLGFSVWVQVICLAF